MPSKHTDEAEQALRRSEQRYRQIVDTAQEGVWLRDAKARTVFVNRRLCEMLGYSVAEMLGRPVYDFMDPDGRAEAERRFVQRKRGNVSSTTSAISTRMAPTCGPSCPRVPCTMTTASSSAGWA